MSAIKLVIGDKSRSSWSLRAWLFLKHHGVPFTEQVVELDRPDTHQKIVEHSPSGRVPLLMHGAVQVWESSAICEYAAETFALPQAWPLNPASRAFARSIAAEMHAGFADLRKELPFYAYRDPEAQAYSERASADIRRICAIWREARPKAKAGRWLFGQFGIADAMFAPVAVRFHIYKVKLDAVERDYVDTLIEHPAMKLWFQGAAEEQAAAAKATAAAAAAEPTPKPRGFVVVPTALAVKPAAAPPPPAAPPVATPASLAAPAAPPVAKAAQPQPARKPAATPASTRAPASAAAAKPPGPAELRPATPIPDPEPDTKEHGPPPRFKSVILPPD